MTRAMLEVIGLVLAAILAENMVLVRCFGVGRPLGEALTGHAAWHMGAGLTLVMTASALASWTVNTFVLRFFNIEHFRLLVYALLVPAVVWLLRQVLRLFFPVLYRHLDEYLSQAVSNCAVLGVAFLITSRSYTLGKTLLYSLASGVGVLLVLVSVAGIRDQSDPESCPRVLRGLPLDLITLGLMALALMGFYGLHVTA